MIEPLELSAIAQLAERLRVYAKTAAYGPDLDEAADLLSACERNVDDLVVERVEELHGDAAEFDKDLWKNVRAFLNTVPGFDFNDYDDGMTADDVYQYLCDLFFRETRPGRRVDETGWVIELGQSEPSHPQYWAAPTFEHENLKAIRFARKEDAERVARSLIGGNQEGYYRIADHMWCP